MNKTKQPSVSIVMCVYNGEEFLDQQITSILNQTYSDFELLILNDRSTDSSALVIESYLKKDSRIKYSQNDSNIGFNKNFEKGLGLANADLIMISDQDDIWMENKIAELVKHLNDNLLIYSNSELINEKGQKLDKKLDHQIKHPNNPSFKSFLAENFISGHTCLFRKQLLKFILPFPDNVYFYDWWIGFTASYVGKVKYLDSSLTLYRIHGASVMKNIATTGHHKKYIKQRKLLQLAGFSEAEFLNPPDRKYVKKFLSVKTKANRDPMSFGRCYCFLLKNHPDIFPWYKKSLIKKLNFLRKQCLE